MRATFITTENRVVFREKGGQRKEEASSSHCRTSGVIWFRKETETRHMRCERSSWAGTATPLQLATSCEQKCWERFGQSAQMKSLSDIPNFKTLVLSGKN
jgi:hypothetical protein